MNAMNYRDFIIEVGETVNSGCYNEVSAYTVRAPQGRMLYYAYVEDLCTAYALDPQEAVYTVQEYIDSHLLAKAIEVISGSLDRSRKVFGQLVNKRG